MASEVRRISPLELQANRFALVSRLADDLAHEIKNPLHAIVINLELVKRRAEAGDMATVLQRAELAGAEVMRVNTLVEQLLQLLRPVRKDEVVRDLDGVVEEMLPLLQQQARLARVELVYDGTRAQVQLPMRRDALRMVLLNLVAHALDELAAVGGRVELSAVASDGGVQLAVAEAHSGAAVPARPAGPARTGSPPGDAGFDRELGVAIVRSLVEEAGGAFSIERVSGGGTRRVVQFSRSAIA